jgi:predicted DNA-binding protein
MMADFPDTICFKAPRWMTGRIRELAEAERRPLAAMVRVIVERYLEKEKDGKLQPNADPS